jgi:predicted ATPase
MPDKKRASQSSTKARGKKRAPAEAKRDTCFVIMPFGDPFDSYYLAIYVPAIEAAGLTARRADDLFRPSTIVSDIWALTREAKLILADLSGKNPNVFYELGLAHAVEKPAILVSQSMDDVPFDLRSLRIITYDKNHPNWGDVLRDKIEKAIRETLSSPVDTVLPTFLTITARIQQPAPSTFDDSSASAGNPYAAPPVPRKRLIGRDKDVALLCEMLKQQHIALVTLTGPPGTGKTRLAIAAAASLNSEFPDGIVYVELSSIRDSGLVLSTIAQALHIREHTRQSILETLKAELFSKNLLLVLDNFEQVLAAGPEIEKLLVSCYRTKILVTSRRSLNITHEREFPVSPLLFPRDSKARAADLRKFPAIQLFVEAARAVDHNFNPTNSDYSEIANICSRLDGLPLAIELAAARIKVFKTPGALRERLFDPSGHLEFDMFTAGATDADPKQQTLEAMISWSYELLHENEKQILRQLSVFAGGCTLTSAAAVSEQINIFNDIAALVDSNLLVHREGPDRQPRFSMLETVREYSLKQLRKHSEEKSRAEEQHASYFLAQAESAQQHLADPDMKRRVDWFKVEQDNMRAALSWALQHNQEMALRLAYALSDFWNILGQLTEERVALNRALVAAIDAPADLQMRVLGRAGARQSNPDDAKVWATRHLELSRITGNAREEAWALHNLGNIARVKGQLSDSRELLESAVALFRQQQDETGLAITLLSLGVLAVDQDDFDFARTVVTESHELTTKLSLRGHLPLTRTYLAFLLHKEGERAAADKLIKESLAMLRQDGRQSWLPWGLHWKGRISLERGELETARDDLAESLTIFQTNEDRGGQIRSLLAFACLYAVQGDFKKATTLLAAEAVHREEEGSPTPADWRRKLESIDADARQILGSSGFKEAYEAGRQMSLAQAVAYALET